MKSYLVVVSTDVCLIQGCIVNNAIIVYIDLASTVEAFVKWNIKVVGDSLLAILLWLFCIGFRGLLPRGFALWRHSKDERTVNQESIFNRNYVRGRTVHQGRRRRGRPLAVRKSLVLMQVLALESPSAPTR